MKFKKIQNKEKFQPFPERAKNRSDPLDSKLLNSDTSPTRLWGHIFKAFETKEH